MILIYSLGAASILFSLLLALWISTAKIAKPLSQLAQRMGTLAGGDLAVEIDGQNRRDEIGAMAKAVQVFKDNAVREGASEGQAAEQRRPAEEERAPQRSGARRSGAPGAGMVVDGAGPGLERLAAGDLTYRVLSDSFTDDYKQIRTTSTPPSRSCRRRSRAIALSTREVAECGGRDFDQHDATCRSAPRSRPRAWSRPRPRWRRSPRP